MSKKLIIAEKPSVAGDIARSLGNLEKRGDYFEGNDYVVASVSGHIVELYNPQEETPDRKRSPSMRGQKWSFESLPALPDEFALRPNKDAEGRTKTISKLASRKDVSSIINACDAGREGELIFSNLISYLKIDKPIERLWLQSMTATAIRDGFAHLRSSQETASLQSAAVARSQADWMVGINSTRALTALNSKDGGFVLTTVGRVQTPTLAFLVARQRMRDAHVVKPYWRVHADFAVANGDSWRATLVDLNYDKNKAEPDQKRNRFWDEQHVQALAAEIQGKQVEVSDESREQTRQPPGLFKLSALQREANRRFGLPANATLRSLQSLYERKLLTYPRTDSAHLPPDYIAEVKRIHASLAAAKGVSELSGFAQLCGKGKLDEAVVKAGKRIFDASKVSDHFAIIPTGEHPKQLNRDIDRKLYELICRSFVASFMPPAKIKITTRQCTYARESEPPAVFEARGQVVIESGWLAAIDKHDRKNEFPDIADGTATATEVEVEALETKPVAHYTDASLLSDMEGAGRLVDDAELSETLSETGGLGTPATRASIIEELIRNDYVVRDGRDLIPTRKAFALMEILNGIGVDELTRPELTGKWESRLYGIEKGSDKPQVFIADIRSLVEDITSRTRVYDPDATPGFGAKLSEPCPRCGGTIVESYRKYVCDDCKFHLWKNVASRLLSLKEAEQLLRDKRVGPFDDFKSRRGQLFTASIVLPDSQSGKITFEFDEQETGSPETMEPIGTCPKCSSRVLIGERNYLCEKTLTEDKQCDFSFRRQLLDRDLTEEEVAKLLSDRKTGLLDGFVSRKRHRRAFSAHLIITDDNKIGFEFANAGNGKKRPAKKGSKKATKAKKAAKKPAKKKKAVASPSRAGTA